MEVIIIAITNLSESYNVVLKNVRNVLVSAAVNLKCVGYFQV